MTDDLQNKYHENLNQYDTLLKITENRNRLISYLRLTLFIVACLLIYFFSKAGSLERVFLTIGVSILLFAVLLKFHSRIIYRMNLYKAYGKIYQNELSVLDGKYDQFENGIEFNQPEHPFAFDIDLFGEGSLFQFLNRTVTHIGKQRLSEKLKNPVIDQNLIRAYQKKIKALKDNPDWRHFFMAIGMVHKEEKEDTQRILNWVKMPAIYYNRIY